MTVTGSTDTIFSLIKTDAHPGLRGPGRVRGQGVQLVHRDGSAVDVGRRHADDNGRRRRRGRENPKTEETAARIGRDGGTIGGGGGGGGRLLRAANTGRRGRRRDGTAGGRLLRRVRPVRGQRAPADGQTVGDHRQAADQRSAVPGPDGNVEREHEDRDAFARQTEERRDGNGGAPSRPSAVRRATPRVDRRRRVHGDFLRRAAAVAVARKYLNDEFESA